MQSIGHDYTDHCATTSAPLSFRDFFDQKTFYHGRGDWATFKNLHTDLGEEPKMDAYILLRKDTRNQKVRDKLEELNRMVEEITNRATADNIPPRDFPSNKANVSHIHHFSQLIHFVIAFTTRFLQPRLRQQKQ